MALTLFFCAVLDAPAHAAASRQSAARAVPRFGIAHADLMELHLKRQPGAPAVESEQLAPDAIADRYRRARELGVGWHRWTLYHDLVESDGFHWEVPDGIVSRDVANDLATLAVIQGHPSEGLDAPAFQRADGALTDDPAAAARVNSGNPWARFVSALVERYKPGGVLARERSWPAGAGIRAWEAGNEPNNPHFWRDSVAAYVRFLEITYLVVKFHDPIAIVVHGGIDDGGNALDWYGRFAAALAARAAESPLPARNGYYFDRIGWHWYTAPGNLVVKPAEARALLHARGIPDKPVWITEVGMPTWSEYPGPCWDAASPGRATLGEQAGFVWQVVAEGLAEGVESMVLFQLYDDCGNGETSYDAHGLVRNHATNQCWAPVANQGCWRYEPAMAGMPRPAYDAYRTIVAALSAARVTDRGGGDGWRYVSFASPSSGRVVLAWSTGTSDRSVTIGATAGQAEIHVLEPTGIARVAAVPAGPAGYRLVLPGATNRNGPAARPLMAGRPALVIERAGRAGAPASVPGSGIARAAMGTADAEGSSDALALGSSTGASAAPGRDARPPFLAVVRELPAVSPTALEIEIMSADDRALGAYVVYYSVGGLPRTPTDWIPVGSVAPWPGTPSIGTLRVPFTGAPGQTYFFSAQAGDTAGNWTPVPQYAQAATRIRSTAQEDASRPRTRAGTPSPGTGTGAAAGPSRDQGARARPTVTAR